MSLCDCRGLFANDKEVARRRSVSREPQALLACESLIQRRAASRGSDEVIHKKHRHKQRAASLLACESLTQSKRADELISGSLSIMLIILMIIMPLIVELIKATKKVAAPLQGMRLLSR